MNGTRWFLRAGVQPADLGYLASMLDQDDTRPAREQFDSLYMGGSHWRSDPKFTIDEKDRLCYPGDFVVILQPDRSFIFQRMD